jgi:hypothetical protein
MVSFEDACVESPAGTILLAAVEARERSDVSMFEPPQDSSPAAVEAAVRRVGSMTFGALCSIAVTAAESLVGPWVGGAAGAAAAAYRCAEARRPIAAVVGARFDRELHAPMDPDRQQWWTLGVRQEAFDRRPLFQNYDDVYGNGEFTWAGLWTVTDPPPELHEGLRSVWEIYPGPVSRWRLPVAEGARVYELHRPQDWLALVAAHPVDAIRPHEGWELPGPNQSIGGSGLLDLPQQKAAVSELSGHILPDWSSVANSFDAVHLSWAGFITTEGYVIAAGDRVFTMLRYWGSERTHWLSDCFGVPEPLEAPVLSESANGDLDGSGSTGDHSRTTDRTLLNHLLGR